MTDTATTQTVAAAPKPKTVLEDMESRRMFDTTADAAAYLNSMIQTISDFETHSHILKGVSAGEDGAINFDPAIYSDQMRVMVAVLTQRIDKQPSKVLAIVVTPAPKLSAILASPLGMDWLNGIVDTQLNNIAVRTLRGTKEKPVDDLELAAEAMPLTLDQYLTSRREGAGGQLQTFNDLARGIIDAIARENKIWAKARLTKPELKSAMSSRAYAAEYYPTLEDRGEGKESMFVKALAFGSKVAKAKGLDPAIFDRWLATRDEATLAQSEDDGDIDLDALTFDEPEAAAPAPTAEPVAAPEPAPTA